MQVVKTNNDAILPTQNATGYDLYTPLDYNLYPHIPTQIFLGYMCRLPSDYYAVIHGRNSFATHAVHTHTSILRSNTCRSLYVVLTNMRARPITIARGKAIANLHLYRIFNPPVTQLSSFDGDSGSNNQNQHFAYM